MAVVKADAYGHGAVRISKYLQSLGVYNFAVASIDEAIELRENNIEGEILVFGYTPISRKPDLIKYDITQTIIDGSYVNEICETEGKIKAHVKIDTGMNRLGEKSNNIDKILSIYKNHKIEITGTYSYLSRSDSTLKEDIEFTNNQISKFNEIITYLKKKVFV